MALSTDPGVWVAAILTLSVWTIIYKENKIFRIAEMFVVGSAVGYFFAMGFNSVIVSGVMPLLKGDIAAALGLVVGPMIFCRFIKRYAWLSRFPVAMLMGIGSGTTLRLILDAQIIAMIRAAALPVSTPNLFNDFNNLLAIIIVATTLSYFLFAKRIRTSTGLFGRLGRFFLLVAFAASFGQGLYGRTNVYIERMYFIIATWLGLVR